MVYTNSIQAQNTWYISAKSRMKFVDLMSVDPAGPHSMTVTDHGCCWWDVYLWFCLWELEGGTRTHIGMKTGQSMEMVGWAYSIHNRSLDQLERVREVSQRSPVSSYFFNFSVRPFVFGWYPELKLTVAPNTLQNALQNCAETHNLK